jgi:uncharacterized membrane protein HdeD (DUF308 family)
MVDQGTKNLMMFEGMASIIFGVAAVFWPKLTIGTLLYIFATFILAVGIINMVSGIFQIKSSPSSWYLRLLVGALELGVGVYLLRHPKVTFATFILLIGFTLIINGLFRVVISLSEKLPATLKTMLLIAGLLSFLVGIVVLFQPVAAGVAFVWILGLYALLTGPVILAAAFDQTPAKK